MSKRSSNLSPIENGDVEDIRDAVAALSKKDKRRRPRGKQPVNTAETLSSGEVPREAQIAIGEVGLRSEEVAPWPSEAHSINDEATAFFADEAFRSVEAVLFASAKPLSAQDLARVAPEHTDIASTLMAIQTAYRQRGVNLVEVAGKWRFQTASDLSHLFEDEREAPRKLSKAALETLAVIAYCQPVTRAEIEDVRGVAVSKGTIDVLMEQSWVRMRGRRRTPGRPITYGVSEQFLEHFNLESLDLLPGLEEMRAAGLLNSAIPEDFTLPGATGEDVDDDEMLASFHDRGDTTDFVTNYIDENDD